MNDSNIFPWLFGSILGKWYPTVSWSRNGKIISVGPMDLTFERIPLHQWPAWLSYKQQDRIKKYKTISETSY